MSDLHHIDHIILPSLPGKTAMNQALAALAEGETLMKLEMLQASGPLMRKHMANRTLIVVRDAVTHNLQHLLYEGNFVLSWDDDGNIAQAHIGNWIHIINSLFEDRSKKIFSLKTTADMAQPVNLADEMGKLLLGLYSSYDDMTKAQVVQAVEGSEE